MTMLLMIFLFMYAVLGAQLFGGQLLPNKWSLELSCN